MRKLAVDLVGLVLLELPGLVEHHRGAILAPEWVRMRRDATKQTPLWIMRRHWFI